VLALQKPPQLLAHPEEQLFQITHQSAEPWLKQLDYEVDLWDVIGELTADFKPGY
jgi:tryptophan 2,3-dioxygenase